MPIVDTILEILYTLGEMVPRPFETKYAWNSRLRNMDRPQFNRGVRHLAKRGLLKVTVKNTQHFLELTKAGQLEPV